VKAMSEAMTAKTAMTASLKVAITGGGRDILALAEAAITLKAGTGCGHPELFAFRTWGEVQDYAENDPAAPNCRCSASSSTTTTPRSSWTPHAASPMSLTLA
jgi:hypothetical protein